MTSRDRVLASLAHQRTDYVPYEFQLSVGLKEALLAETGITNLPQKAHCDVVCAEYSPSGEWIRPGFFQDGFGVVWNRSGADRDIGLVDNLVIPDPETALIRLPAVDTAGVHAFFQNATVNKGDTFLFGELGFTLFERAWTLCGMENLLVYMILEPEFTHALFDRICEYNLEILKIALQYPLDGFHFGDDWGQQKGLIMGPAHWNNFIKPHLARMYAAVRGAGIPVSQHSCGDISELFGTLIDIGLNCYQTFQPEIHDPAAFKRNWGGQLSVWGGVSTQRVLPFETPEGVRAATAGIIRQIGQNAGGMIAAPTHMLPPDVPVANLLAMVDVFEHQDKYL